ncbi:uncharacterized protein LOC143279775 isoform X2 [Babylonia areolata]|uniref:uncharacterized protein LOC143279775 isoform X2 n=1 Tax=Babylonia areolata TaxID=304850 RepID=UPI003FD5C1AD
MTSSAPSLPSPSSDAKQITDVDICSHSSDNDNCGKDVMTGCQVTCNGAIPNSSLPAVTSPAQSSSPPSRRKNVSTVFSSNHRKSWQRSLSNYSQDKSRKDSTPSPDRRETLELQSRSPQHHADSFHSSATDSSRQENVCRPYSTVVVYADEAASETMASGDPELGQDQSGVGGHGQGVNVGRGQDVLCECGEQVCRCASETCRLLNEQEGAAEARSAVRAGNPGGPDTVPLNLCSEQDPHRLRHHHTPPSSANNEATQTSQKPGSQRDSIELSVYPSSTPSQPSNPTTTSVKVQDSLAEHPKPSTSASPTCNQSVSVLKTGDQSNPVSVSSHRKRKDSDQSGKTTSSSEHKDGRQKRKGQPKEQGVGKRVHRQGPRTSDCTPDTQPLLSTPQVRVVGGLHSGSPDLCLDSSLHRFHSLDSREACCGGGKGSGQRTASGSSPYQRALSVNTASTAVPVPTNLAAHLALDASHLLVENLRAASPAGTESLGAPPLNELYRYHVFLSHCAQDLGWVQEIVARLGSPPYGYKCVYTSEEEKDPTTLEQNLLCSAMLSERVVLVLSKQYVQDTWFTFEKVLRQLTQMSLQNQRIMGVLLEDCHIPESLGELYFLDCSDPDFFDVFAKRLKTGRIPRSSESVSSDLGGKGSVVAPSVVNGQTLAQCNLAVKVGWDSFLQVEDSAEELPPTLKVHGINLEKTEFYAIVHNVSTVVKGSNKLPWVLCVQPLLFLILAAALWLPAFIAVLAVQVDDTSGMALPVRLVVFVFPLGIVSCGYLLKWRRRYWLSKLVRVLVQNCVKANQLLYCEGRPVLTTAGHVRANNFAVYFIYFDLTDCVRSVDLLLFTCLEDDWDKLMRLVEFYARDKAYLSQVSMSERLTVMMAAAYIFKMVRGVLPQPPQQRHLHGQLCLCQFTEECVTRFVHSLDREDVTALTELFTRHLFGYVSGSAVHRVNTEIFHRLQ